MQYFQSLRRDFHVQLGHACDVAARPAETLDEAELNRVRGAFEHDWNGLGRRFRGQRCWRAGRGDDCDLTPNQIGSKRREMVVLVLRPAVFDGHVAAIDVTGLTETIEESLYLRGIGFGRRGIKEANHRRQSLLGPR